MVLLLEVRVQITDGDSASGGLFQGGSNTGRKRHLFWSAFPHRIRSRSFGSYDLGLTSARGNLFWP